jgi:hypothetical protein
VEHWREIFGLYAGSSDANFFHHGSQDSLQSPAYTADTRVTMHAFDIQSDAVHNSPFILSMRRGRNRCSIPFPRVRAWGIPAKFALHCFQQQPMTARFARIYLYLLLAANLLLLDVSIGLHIRVLSGYENSFEKHGHVLTFYAFVVAFAVLSLAKERNVWKNEFKDCPRWLKIATLSLTIYAFLVGLFQAVAGSGAAPLESEELGASVIPIFFLSMMPCILYALLWAAPLKESELIKRVRNSLIALTLCVAFFLAYRSGYLPHHGG